MAGHLMRHNVEGGDSRSKVYVWNRTQSKALEHAKEFGTISTSSSSELVEKCDFVFMCLPNSKVVEDVIDSIMTRNSKLKGGKIFIDCTSGDPAITRMCSKKLRNANAYLVDAPVSGGPKGAKNGTLTVMMGGEDAHVKKVAVIVSKTFGKVVRHVGAVGAGHATKSVNNALNVTQLVMASGALLWLRKRYDVAPSKALGVINNSSGRSLQTQVRIPDYVCTGKYGYGFKIGLMLKDVRIALNVVKGLSDEYFKATEQFLEDAVKRFGYDADYTEVVRVLEAEMGLTLRDDEAKASL
jgi:3-hydroxyisobutyrate dehydrogenase